MGNVYRIFTADDEDFTCGGSRYQSGVEGGGMLPLDAFEGKFQAMGSLCEIPKVEMFTAPEIEEEWIAYDFILDIKNGASLPDVWTGGAATTLVSGRVKEIVETLDDMSHQFWPCEVFDRNGMKVNASPYYHISIRRFVRIYDTPLEFPKWPYQASDSEAPMMQALIRQPKLAETLAEFPIWRLWRTRTKLFVNRVLLDALRSSGCTGLDDYQEYYGQPGEGVVCCG